MSRAPHWSIQVFSLELRRLLSYRVDFWMQFLGPVISQLGVAYFLWRSIYAARGGAEIGGFSFQGMMIYYLLVSLMDRIVVAPSWNTNIMLDIYEGGLSRYLVYPVPYFGYKLVLQTANALFGCLQLLLGLFAYKLLFGFPAEWHLNALNLCIGLMTALLAGFVSFLCVSILHLVAFWADNVWSLEVMFRFALSLLGGAYLPLSLFPAWSQKILAWLPFSVFVWLPVQATLGRVSPVEYARTMQVTALWAAALVGALAWVWRRGLKRYSGVGI